LAAQWQRGRSPQLRSRRRNPIQATTTTANSPRIEVLRVKPIDPAAASNLRFQLSDVSVDLMKSFTLDGFDGVGGAWKIPPTDETFDARYGRW
jgi:hypothetical protein